MFTSCDLKTNGNLINVTLLNMLVELEGFEPMECNWKYLLSESCRSHDLDGHYCIGHMFSARWLVAAPGGPSPTLRPSNPSEP